jgi:chromate transporter
MIRMKTTTQQLFTTFFKVGAFTIGGGYAMIPVIEAELVTKQEWLTTKEFYDAVSVAQAIPGIIAVHMGMYMGYKLGGVKGAALSMLGVILPSFLMILGIAALFIGWGDVHPAMASVFQGIRVSVVALISYAGYKLLLVSKNRLKYFMVPVVFGVVYFTTINPFFIILTVVGLAALAPRKGAADAYH